MAVSLARYNYTKTPLSSRRRREAAAGKVDFPALPVKSEVKSGSTKKRGQDRTVSPLFIRNIRGNLKATLASHPSHDLMAELRQGSQPVDPLSAWWSGHMAVSLQRHSATELNTAGLLERVSVFRCDGNGRVAAPDNFRMGDPICPPIPLRSIIYYKPNEEVFPEAQNANRYMSAYIDPATLAQDVINNGCVNRSAHGMERISLWDIKSLRVGLISLVSQWKEQLHNAADTHFCYGGLEREYACSCTSSKKHLMITAIQDIITLNRFDKPLEPERKSQLQHPLHPISGFEMGTLLVASAHEVKNRQNGKPEAIIFVNELVQHMLRTYESDIYKSSLFNVSVSVTLTNTGGPCMQLHATRDIARGDILAAAFDTGVERFNPFACAKRYQEKRSLSNAAVNGSMEPFIISSLVTARAFMTMVARNSQVLEQSETILYSHATDTVVATLIASAKLSERFRAYIHPIIRDIITLLNIPETPMNDPNTTINRRRREGRALAFWAHTLSVRLESLKK